MSENCANPLLLGWIKEWLDEARERGSKGITVYKKAYDSMKACPLSFNHPSEAQQLNGLGPKLCDRLTEKLKLYCAENGLPAPEAPQPQGKASKRSAQQTNGLPEDSRAKKAAKKTKPYVPSLRSGPYALLLGLSTLDEDARTGLTKAELIDIAQEHCDSSFTAPPDPSKFYTAWKSMQTLIQKDLVYEYGRPTRKYLLTEDGWEIAKRIRKTAADKPANQTGRQTSQQESDNGRPLERTQTLSSTSGAALDPNGRVADLRSTESIRLSTDPPNRNSATTTRVGTEGQRDPAAFSTSDQHVLSHTALVPTSETIRLPPDSFTIELVLDVREVRTKKDRDYISNELVRRGITPIVRSLELGDAFWVAKCKDPNLLASYGEEGDEVMLDWIIERKRLDDLIGSIKDGRFHEQKFRLRRSCVKNVVYLIEEFAAADASATGPRYQEAVASAIASTQVVNGYFVKKTRNLDDTIRYLARMTTMLRNMYTKENSQSSSWASQKTNKISIIPTRSIDSLQTYSQLLERFRAEDRDKRDAGARSTTYATTYPTFSALTSKSEMLSLRDVFLKMLMCTRGVTGDKALEIQRRWRTPREFAEAFEELENENNRSEAATTENTRKKPSAVSVEDMVASQMSGLVGRKKVGKALSKRIAEVWGPQA